MTGQMDPRTLMMMQLLQQGGQQPQYTAAPVSGGPGSVARSPGASATTALAEAGQQYFRMMALQRMIEKMQKQSAPTPEAAQAPAPTDAGITGGGYA